ncbi:hypothetical protein GOODEAATRI_017946, partial [Goodea atripinnis]
FNPGLVLVSAGFDAAQGDPLGGYHVTPEGYAHLTHMLMSLAGGRVLILLEGGYNLTSISDSMAMCTSVLLGDPPPSLVVPLPPPHHCALATISDVIRQQAPYWQSLRIKIPESVRAGVPSPKHRGKRSSQDRKSDKQSLPAAGEEVSTDTLYVVDPLPWCPHLDAVKAFPHSGIDVFQPCGDCGSDTENWICLTCYQVCCGRYVNEHMVIHGATLEHPMVLSFSDLSVWCYLCESYVHHQNPTVDCYRQGTAPLKG